MVPKSLAELTNTTLPTDTEVVQGSPLNPELMREAGASWKKWRRKEENEGPPPTPLTLAIHLLFEK